jgi:hypothetical protein
MISYPILYLFIWFFVVLGFEHKASTFSHSTSPFFVCVMDFFEIGSCELFAQADFEPQSS